MVNAIQSGDHVTTPRGNVHWIVVKIESKIDPLGVLLSSGKTGRTRRETYANLNLFKKGRP